MNVANLYTRNAAMALALMAGWTVLAAEPQPGAPARAQRQSSRFLLVVETSSPMEKRIKGLSAVLQDLLGTGMHGQLRRGDTVGVWTFNQELYGGRLPVQPWLDNPKTTCGTIMNHIAAQTFEKQAQLDKVLTAMMNLVKGSESLTVILISTGQGKLSGTPFDDEINKYYETWGSQQNKAKMPFVTVLRGTHGKLTKYAINTAPWPVEIPALERTAVQLAQDPARKAVAKPATMPPTAAAPTPGVAPLIVIGKKPEPVQPAAPAPSMSAPTTAGPGSASVTRTDLQAATVTTSQASTTLVEGPTEPPASSAQPQSVVAMQAVVPESKNGESVSASSPAGTPLAAAAAPSTPAAPVQLSPAPAPASAPVAPAARQSSGRTWFDPALGLILLTAFMAGGGIVAWFILRHRQPEVSLITRSLQLSSKP